MNRFPLLLLAGITLISSCTTSNTKIKSFPRTIGYRMHEKIVMTPITGVNERDNERLMRGLNESIQQDKIFLTPVWCYDAVYQAKQQGITIPLSVHDSTALNIVHQKLAIDYIIVSSVTGLKEYWSNNDYIGQATLSMYVIDVKNKTVVWQSSTRTTQSPFGTDNSWIQGSGDADSALQIACRKTLRKLVKAFDLLPNRKK